MSSSCTCIDHVVGHAAKREFTVSPSDTAIALGSGSVNVLATPMAIAWCEAVTTMAISEAICADCTTVGYKIDFLHLSPTSVGESVYANALVESVSGDRIIFSIDLRNAEMQVGTGKITRVRVARNSWI
ncbi:MAG: thioesterase family protein [Candidatus Nanopelagicales bacterium]